MAGRQTFECVIGKCTIEGLWRLIILILVAVGGLNLSLEDDGDSSDSCVPGSGASHLQVEEEEGLALLNQELMQILDVKV